jgi:hypothetical protein
VTVVRPAVSARTRRPGFAIGGGDPEAGRAGSVAVWANASTARNVRTVAAARAAAGEVTAKSAAASSVPASSDDCWSVACSAYAAWSSPAGTSADHSVRSAAKIGERAMPATAATAISAAAGAPGRAARMSAPTATRCQAASATRTGPPRRSSARPRAGAPTPAAMP